MYAIYIIKDKWIEAEDYMIDKKSANRYAKEFYDVNNLSNIRMQRDISKLLSF